MLKGSLKVMNRDLSVKEQTEQLSYDKRWEFPKHRLKLGACFVYTLFYICRVLIEILVQSGTQLGAGCFGVVVKAEAAGIKGSNEISKTVAVKMLRSKTNVTALEDLVSELKVMIYLGSHLNIINLLGACTKNIHKGTYDNQEIIFKFENLLCHGFVRVGELLIIVEYCRFGNLQNYLIKNRNDFINQVDEFGNMRIETTKTKETDDGSVIPQETATSLSCLRDSGGYVAPCSSIDSDGYLVPITDADQSFSTKYLLSCSFQIARGMGYLSSKKVLTRRFYKRSNKVNFQNFRFFTAIWLPEIFCWRAVESSKCRISECLAKCTTKVITRKRDR